MLESFALEKEEIAMHSELSRGTGLMMTSDCMHGPLSVPHCRSLRQSCPSLESVHLSSSHFSSFFGAELYQMILFSQCMNYLQNF